ncbi:MAG: hypothetical protein HWE25_03930 [Alphaproteobacteria bacterium]|nr:hypothetical protein [Alphaproteobacteria bacterium]
MPNINLELQLKFLNELNEALTDALDRYSGEGAEKLAELNYMKQEVSRARRVITDRMDREDDSDRPARSARRRMADSFQEAVYS